MALSMVRETESKIHSSALFVEVMNQEITGLVNFLILIQREWLGID